MKKLLLSALAITISTIFFAQTTLTTATDFSVKDTEGNTIHLFDILDMDMFACIDFFSTSCGPCSYYSPDFQLSYEDFGANEGNVYHFSICWGDDNIGVSYYQQTYGLTFPAVSGFDGGGNQIYHDYDIQSYPTVILIAPDREIVEQYIWEPTQQNINDAIVAAGGTLVDVPENRLVEEFGLYPNPVVNGKTRVEFSLKEAAAVTVDVFNLLGKRVYSSGQEMRPFGSHNISLNLEELPKGTYFTTLSANDEVIATTKLIIAR
jgi:thiol-disulfide isomerase/thioredoxin